jgi:hypothetical protein
MCMLLWFRGGIVLQSNYSHETWNCIRELPTPASAVEVQQTTLAWHLCTCHMPPCFSTGCSWLQIKQFHALLCRCCWLQFHCAQVNLCWMLPLDSDSTLGSQPFAPLSTDKPPCFPTA